MDPAAMQDSWFDIYARDGRILVTLPCAWEPDGDGLRLAPGCRAEVKDVGEPWRWELKRPGEVVIAGVVNRRGKNRINFGGKFDGSPGPLQKKLYRESVLSIHTFSLQMPKGG